MAEISGRRPNQLGNLMFHLKFATIDFQQIFDAAVEHFGERLHGAGLSRSGGTQKKKHADGPVLRRKAGLKHLNVRHNDADYIGLTNYLRREY